MAYFRLALAAGIDKQNTEYGAEGGWTDCDNVRFRFGLPEKIGGWQEFGDFSNIYLVGRPSDIITWTSLTGVPYAMVGTHKKLYVSTGGAWFDVTPIRETTAAGDVTFSASNGSAVITVTDTAHGALAGDFVTYSGAVSLGGNITAALLNAEYEVTEVLTVDTYTITASIAADASDTGNGGSSVVGAYQINTGSDFSYFDFGWGTGTWGASTWGTPRSGVTGISLAARVWQLDLFGEDVICQLQDGKTFRWDLSAGTTTRATQVTGAPTKSKYALVSSPDRHLVLLGTETTIGDPASQDPMFVRFSDQEDINTFAESATNTAGGQRLTDGNEIVTAIRSRGQLLIITDTSLHGMQYIGPPYTFGFTQLGANCGCSGPHAAIDVNGIAFWMGIEAFYLFDGTVKKLPSTVQDYVFEDINLIQRNKVYAGLNSQFNEVTWFYCSSSSDYVDRCVTYNYVENVWSIGTLSRTAWQDYGAYDNPLATEYDSTGTESTISTIYGLTAGRAQVYEQEKGINANGQPISAFITSGYFDIGDGDNMMYMKRFIPDFKDQQGDLTVNLFLRAYPQSAATNSSLDPYTVSPTTQKIDTRARGRQISLKITSSALDTDWRYGTLRVDIQPDGIR
tara:strand:- start:4422 stop:6290 length:1869 start_codon:yes stop_codon:yes gene_type:complete